MSFSTNRQWSKVVIKRNNIKSMERKPFMLVTCIHVTTLLLYELWTYRFFQRNQGEGNRANVCTRKRLQKNKGARADGNKRDLWEYQWGYILFYLKRGHSLHKSQTLELASLNSYDSLGAPKFWPAIRSIHVYLRMDVLFSWTLLQVEWWVQRGRPLLSVTACSKSRKESFMGR